MNIKKTKKTICRAKTFRLNIPDTCFWKYEKPYAMSKAELAEKLGHCSSKELFANHVHTNERLMSILKHTGYKIRSKKLTQKQVDLICDTVGRPIISETEE
ncbi:MAG: hypothetical protein MJ197_03630 [Bacteroidales bacterium]|nr:hypothetical protein [Bacteroidales bacterium]